MNFSTKNLIEKLMVPSESTPQELSDEWSCQYVRFDNLKSSWGNFCAPPLVTEVNMRP
jgi:hypothetical protein